MADAAFRDGRLPRAAMASSERVQRMPVRRALPLLLAVLSCILGLSDALSLSRARGIAAVRAVRVGERLEESFAAGAGGFLVIDGDNVRGKTRFELSKESLVFLAKKLSKKYPHTVILHLDHGSRHSAYDLGGLGLVFSGSRRSADDVIARDVPRLLETLKKDAGGEGADSAPLMVVTGDAGLAQRCRSGARGFGGRSRLSILQSDAFAEFLQAQEAPLSAEEEAEAAALGLVELFDDGGAAAAPDAREGSAGEAPGAGEAPEASAGGSDERSVMMVSKELNIRRGITNIRRELSRGCGRKKATKLRRRLRDLESRLAANLATTAAGSRSPLLGEILRADGGGEPIEGTDDDVVAQLLRLGGNRRGREQTWERVVLAERLRQNLERMNVSSSASAAADATSLERYVASINRDFKAEADAETPMQEAARQGMAPRGRSPVRAAEVCLTRSLDRPRWPGGLVRSGVAELREGSCGEPEYHLLREGAGVRVVLVSDTHGYHGTLEGRMPPGDVLVHAGDFSLDSGRRKKDREAQSSFDEWLAAQPYEHKVVVRGNHDSQSWSFPRSNATYAIREATIDLELRSGAALKMHVLPHGSYRSFSVPEGVDLLISHAPPSGLLDTTYSGRCAGSSHLRLGAQGIAKASAGAPPRLWAFGHIHESAGTMSVDIGPEGSPTLLANVANANEGKARFLVRPAMSAVFAAEAPPAPEAEPFAEESRGAPEASLAPRTLSVSRPAAVDSPPPKREAKAGHERILAVDLGLNAGVAAFDNEGRLVGYGHLAADSPSTLAEEVLSRAAGVLGEGFPATRVVLEGDRGFCDSLKEAIGRSPVVAEGAEVTVVHPEAWRADVLVGKERQSGADAKAAARLIARQVIARAGMEQPKGKMKTDAAEAILIGHWAAHAFGWAPAGAAIVERYTNGKVVVP